MKKITLTLVAIAMMLIGGTSPTQAQQVTVDGIDYILEGSNATVAKGNYSGDIVIPAYIEVDGAFYDITAVEKACFQDNTDLESIKFESETMNFPPAAFERCTNLHDVTLPQQAYEFGEWMFAGCAKLQTINIPEGVSFIGNSTFKNCTELYEITLPSSLLELYTDVFVNTPMLQTIYMNASEPPSVRNSPLPSTVTVIVPDALKDNYSSVWNGAVVMSQSDYEHPSAYTTLKVYIELISESGIVYEAGTTPGTYPEDMVNEFEQALISAMMMLEANPTEEECLEAYNNLVALREKLDKSFNPLTDGYYYIVSAYPGFLTNQQEEKAMSADGNQLTWKTFDEKDPTEVFRIVPLANGNFTIQNYASGKYIKSSAYAQASQKVTLTVDPLVEQVIKPIGSLQWLISNTFCDISYHPESHSNGSGKQGDIVTYNGNDLDGLSTWYLRYVDESALEELAAIKAQVALNEELAELISEAYELHDKTVSYIVSDKLITKVDDENPANGQIISNAKETAEGSYAALIDGDLSGTKFFHSSYTSDPQAYHYLQFDLLDNSVSGFQALLALRGDGYGTADAPEVIVVSATNDTTGTAAGTAVLDSICTLNLDWTNVRSQYTNYIDLGQKYRYLRFTVLRTHENRNGGFEHPFFCLGEFQIYGMEIDPVHSQYYYMEGMKDAVDKMMATAGTSEGILANNATTRDDIEKLRADIEAVKELYIDTVALNKAIAYAENLLAKTEVGEQLGQTTQEALDALRIVLDEVKKSAFADPLVKADVEAATKKMVEANEAFIKTIKGITPNTWYYIVSTAFYREGAAGDDDAACIDNVIYASGRDNSNSLMWGLNEEGSMGYIFDPYAMWRFVPVSNTDYYYVQNMGNGFYMGESNGEEATVKVSYTGVPYKIGFLGGGQFELIPANNGNALQLHAKGDGNTVVCYDDGGYNSASSWTFSTVEDKADMIVYPHVLSNFTDVMCLPFNHSGVADILDDVRTFAVKSISYDADTDETTVELYDKDEFAAGEPFIVWIGDPESEADSDPYELLIPFPDDVTDTPINGNGISGCLHGTGFPAQTAFSTGRTYVVSDGGVGIGAQTGVIDPQTYLGPVDGVPTAKVMTFTGLRHGSKADVNGDGIIDTNDVVDIYSYITDPATSSFTLDAADVDGDGKVDTADVVAIYNSIVAGAASPRFKALLQKLLLDNN